MNSFKQETSKVGGKRKLQSVEEGPSDMEMYVTENPKHYARPRPVEGNEEILIDDQEGHTVRVGNALDPQLKEERMKVLKEYRDVFAFSANEMLGHAT